MNLVILPMVVSIGLAGRLLLFSSLNGCCKRMMVEPVKVREVRSGSRLEHKEEGIQPGGLQRTGSS
jgi:hypothetical protein